MPLPAKKKRRVILTALLAVLLIPALVALDDRLVTRVYTINTDGIQSPIRIALVADLHSCRYGEDQRELIDAVLSQSPDLILLGGDIFDDDLPNTNAEAFLRGIADKAPCYYVTGNHEYWSDPERFDEMLEILEELGITNLSGKCETVKVRGETFNLCGVEDPVAFTNVRDFDGFWNQLDEIAEAASDEHYTILLSHRPEMLLDYAYRGFDLVMSGHAHGGQWRIPFLLNGVYAPNQGLFPSLAGGIYESGDTTMIVSRGLARETTRIPRIFNRPELVIAELR